MKKAFSTVEVAKLLEVSTKTVANWCEGAKLKAYRTAGGHRRIQRENLLEFLEEYSMPIPAELIYSSRKRILVVDDEDSILRVITKALAQYHGDFEVETATDGFKAGQAFSVFKPDLVILDINLPGIDGFEVCKLIRETNQNIRIVAITGYDIESYRQKIMKAGADDFMAKPLKMKDLMGIINKLLNV